MTEFQGKNRYAIVDLEATGTGRDAKIIQVGIVLVENGEIIESYETDINPYEKLSAHIKALTGLSDQRLAAAPDFGQVAEEIYRLVKDAIFVAHNVKFDGNLLAEALFFEGFDLLTPRVDTVELAQLFFPTLEKYSLINLVKELDLNLDRAHTAISDAAATAQLLLKIQEKIAALPRHTVEQILQLADNLIFESRLVIDEVYASMSDYQNEACSLVNGLMLKKEPAEQEMLPLSKDFRENIDKLGLEVRQQQQLFSDVMEDRLKSEKQVHFIQAQAGIGKTYGYLLPLLAQTDQPLLVSVPTRILQQQIMEKEGAALAETFHVSIQSIKSPKHFIKLEQFWTSLQRQDSNRLLNRHKMQILVWLCETQTGDLDEFKQSQRYEAYFIELQHDGHTNPDSLFAQWDFWRRLHSKAQRSRILLTNHAYFLHHLKDQPYLIENRLLVIDEAQKLLLTAENFTSRTLAVEPLMQELQRGKDTAETLLEQRLYESCLFELQQLVSHYRYQGKSELQTDELQQLGQSLQEITDLNSRLQELKELLRECDHFWIEAETVESQPIYILRASQLDLLDVASLLPKTKIFCISATLEISKRVSLAGLLGFSEVTRDLLEGRKSNKQEIMLVKDSLDLVELPISEQAFFIAEQLQALCAIERPLLVLFTSVSLLLAVSSVLEEREITHLAQHRDGDEAVLKKRFDKGDSQILLGTGAFWEGVDFSSQSQIIQVIARLPFDNPRDSLVKKINHYLRNQGKQPFYDYNLPVMLLKLKQAIGRTKRSEDQVSLIVLLDNRVLTKRYSRQIKSFLKNEYPVSICSQKELPDKAAAFFDRYRD